MIFVSTSPSRNRYATPPLVFTDQVFFALAAARSCNWTSKLLTNFGLFVCLLMCHWKPLSWGSFSSSKQKASCSLGGSRVFQYIFPKIWIGAQTREKHRLILSLIFKSHLISPVLISSRLLYSHHNQVGVSEWVSTQEIGFPEAESGHTEAYTLRHSMFFKQPALNILNKSIYSYQKDSK